MIALDVVLPLDAFTLRAQASAAGPVLAVLGASGSGKTSLVESIAGLRPAARGHIQVDERRIDLTSAPEGRRIGYVPQDSRLFPHLDVAANVAFGARRTGAADEAVSALGITSLVGRKTADLSGGERGRVALARALATDPTLLLLDEPLAALDTVSRGRVLLHLATLRARRLPIVYVTHHVGEARVLADDVLVLDRGSVVASAPAAGLSDPALLRRAGAGVLHDNLLAGDIIELRASVAVFRTGNITLHVPPSDSLGPAMYSVRATDLLLASHEVTGLSARNVLAGEVREVEPQGGLIRVDTHGTSWLARLSGDAQAELRITPGARVYLVVKTYALERLA